MLNQIVLMGRLTKDPEVRTVGEKQVSKGRFTLAVTDRNTAIHSRRRILYLW